MSFYLPAEYGVDDGHDGGEQEEEGVGKIGEGGDTEDGGLCHAACVPGDEYGDYGGGVFGGAGEEARFIATPCVFVLEHVGG